MTEQPFTPGTVFFRPGDPAERAFLIVAGNVDILDGIARVAMLGPGNVFGEMSLIEERPHGLTARAATAGKVSTLTREEFEHLLQTDPARTRHYLKSLFERLRTLSTRASHTPHAEPAHRSSVTAAHSQPIVPPSDSGPVALPSADPDAEAPARRVVVYPLTRRAAETLPEEGLLLNSFPFRIGRAPGANDPEGMDLNDLWLLDQKPFNVSRNHCEIELDGIRVVLHDRGSNLGCLVNDQRVGGKVPTRSAVLHVGQNVLVLGGAMSPYQFRIEVSKAG